MYPFVVIDHLIINHLSAHSDGGICFVCGSTGCLHAEAK